MSGRNAALRIEGTSALKAQACPAANVGGIIMPFPGILRNSPETGIGGSLESIASRIKKRALDVLEASEMYCSLRYEDFRGCQYGIFSRKGVAVLSIALSMVAVISLILSA